MIEVLTKCCWMCPQCGMSGTIPLPPPAVPDSYTVEAVYEDHERKIETCTIHPFDIACWIEELHINDDSL